MVAFNVVSTAVCFAVVSQGHILGGSAPLSDSPILEDCGSAVTTGRLFTNQGCRELCRQGRSEEFDQTCIAARYNVTNNGDFALADENSCYSYWLPGYATLAEYGDSISKHNVWEYSNVTTAQRCQQRCQKKGDKCSWWNYSVDKTCVLKSIKVVGGALKSNFIEKDYCDPAGLEKCGNENSCLACTSTGTTPVCAWTPSTSHPTIGGPRRCLKVPSRKYLCKYTLGHGNSNSTSSNVDSN